MNKLTKLPDFYGIIKIDFYREGKIRATVEKLKNNPSLCEDLKNSLNRIEYVHSVKILKTLGSLTITYDESKIDAQMMFGIILKLLDLDVEIFDERKSSAKVIIDNLVQALDISVYNKTKSLLDLKTLVAIIFASYGIRQLYKNFTPLSGAGLLWWSYNLLKK